MPERKRIVRFEIVFSCIPFLLRLSQIVEPEPEPHPRPPRKGRFIDKFGFTARGMALYMCALPFPDRADTGSSDQSRKAPSF